MGLEIHLPLCVSTFEGGSKGVQVSFVGYIDGVEQTHRHKRRRRVTGVQLGTRRWLTGKECPVAARARPLLQDARPFGLRVAGRLSLLASAGLV